MTVLGTRPEIIRLSLIIRLLDEQSEHVLVHTGQNYDDRLSRVFFEDLKVREPDEYMGVQASRSGAQIGQIIEKSEELLLKYAPDRVLLLGDTNSGISAIMARRLGIPVYHMEAGNRCYDDRVPEEVNRRIIDHCSTVLMPYTNRSQENLTAEGFARNRIYVTGNPIKQVIDAYAGEIAACAPLTELGLDERRFFLVTAHRAENVDQRTRLQNIMTACQLLYRKYRYPVVISMHPRTRSKLEAFGMRMDSEGIISLQPLRFFDFIHLEQKAFCMISDSGTVQEEACIFGVPNVTIRNVTERPETIECGSNILTGDEPQAIVNAVNTVVSQSSPWTVPEEYLRPSVAETVSRILLSYREPDLAELQWRDSEAYTSRCALQSSH